MRRGFTLIELLICMGTMGCMAGLLLPAVQSSREAARKSHCLNNLHQFGITIHQALSISHNAKIPCVVRNAPSCPSIKERFEDWDSYEQLITDLTLVQAQDDLPSPEVEVITETLVVHGNATHGLYLDGSAR
jgi:hypothetical protein